MDKLVLEAHFLLGTSSSFSTATSALITADLNTNAGVNGVLIRRRMIQHGLTRLITPPATMGPVTSLPVSIGNNRDSTGNYVADTDETQTVSVPGATGLIVHFTRIELETNNQCLNNSCDNIYLTNGDGDLFQVVQGVQAAGATSVAVVGDTVHIRLVSDNSQQRFGYHVDRIDVIGAPPDAGVVLDGGIDVFDGGVIPPPFDGGMMRDAGIPRRDGGVFVDAGRPVIDSGIPVVDAGQPPVSDGGFTSSKTLTALGTEQLSPVISRGCGCGATTGLEAWVGLALLGLINRRRRTS
jgi:hypothetical protein